MHKSYLHVTDKQGELRWLPGFLILQETPDCSLPLGRAQNHTPTAGRASESPKMFPAPAAAGPSAPRQLLRERCILQAASAAPSSPATRLACRQHDRNQNCTTEGGGRKKNKKTASPKSFSVFALHAALSQRIPRSAPSCTARPSCAAKPVGLRGPGEHARAMT